jgi:hypothetical protein
MQRCHTPCLTARRCRPKIDGIMLDATDNEIARVKSYMTSQAPDLNVTFLQKMHVENVLGQQHEVWDVHCDNKERWWVITNPTNLYSQEQFPNMDYAVTFHVGLCLRIPRSEKRKLADIPLEPFAACFRLISEASDALVGAQEVSDYQAIGVRCREATLAFADAAQDVVPWTSAEPKPKRADLKAWADHICSATLAGGSHAERRSLFKSLIKSAWDFSNWLAHAKSSKWHDVEAAIATVEHVLGLYASLVIRHVRGVPETCPACGSHRLSPERGIRADMPDVQWERSVCDRCGWTGEPVQVVEVPGLPEADRGPPEGECIVPTVPLTILKKPH